MNKDHEQGKCPECDAIELDYGALTVQDNSVYYPFSCENCGCDGKEWYNLEFIGHSD